MYRFKSDKAVKKRRPWKKVIIISLFGLIILAGLLAGAYFLSLRPVNPSDSEVVVVTVEEGMNEAQVAGLLESKGLIRSAISYEAYTRLNGKTGKMQAGTYKLSKNLSVSQIVSQIINGEVAVDLLTILPARRLDQLRQSFIDAGYSEKEVDEALDPSQYGGHAALEDLPPLSNLEGYLYPETFQKTANTPLKFIIEASLDQLDNALIDQFKAAYKAHGLSLHEAIILASIVEREVSNTQDREKVAQVFLKRYKEGMPLGSDPTALYGALLKGVEPSVSVDTAYNTRLHAGLPPGPINNVGQASLKAVAFPADTDYLYFVSGDDGKTYFSKTLEQHEALAAKHCIKLCRSY